MEPFIIEEALADLLFFALCGVAAYYVAKYAVRLLVWYINKPKQDEEPAEKLKRAISETEQKLERLVSKITDLEMKHTRFEEEVVATEREVSKWKKLEAKATNAEDERKAVRRRMEAVNRLKAVQQAELESRNAIEEVREKCDELRHRLEMVRNAHATLEARKEAAQIRQDLADDLGNNPDVVIEELENVTIESESRAEAYEETSRFHRNAQATKISEEDVSEEIRRKKESKDGQQQR